MRFVITPVAISITGLSTELHGSLALPFCNVVRVSIQIIHRNKYKVPLHSLSDPEHGSSSVVSATGTRIQHRIIAGESRTEKERMISAS
ncbi:hypothetical protein K474DRAFT_1670026, partial [Panus rudis PR-1116 ss-1]